MSQSVSLRSAAAAVLTAGSLPVLLCLGACAGPPQRVDGDRPRTLGLTIGELVGGAVELGAAERRLGVGTRLVAAFADWSHLPGGPDEVALADGGRRSVLLTWEPHGVRFTDVLSGAQDRYLARVAAALRAYPYRLFLRPWPEMNAPWSTWQPTAAGDRPDGGTPAQFVAAWRYVARFLRAHGVSNAALVFSPDASAGPGSTPVAALWPGSDVVDVLGMDGYNWGRTVDAGGSELETWQSFGAIFDGLYRELTELDPAAPVWVTETGCKEPTVEDDARFPAESSPADPLHSKAQWLLDLASLQGFPRLTAIVLFDRHKERDWRLDSSPAALQASRQLMRSSDPPQASTAASVRSPIP